MAKTPKTKERIHYYITNGVKPSEAIELAERELELILKEEQAIKERNA